MRTWLGGGCALLVGGLLGFAWWWFRQRNRPADERPQTRQGHVLRRVEVSVVVVLMALIGVGTVYRAATSFESVATCRGPDGQTASGPERHQDAPLVAEEVLTWPETGLGLLYGHVVSSKLCVYRPADYYVDYHTGKFAGERFMNVGDVTLAPPNNNNIHTGQIVASHEAHHRPQWAVATVLGGPLAFPVLYSVADFFFPGSHNPFEREADLAQGGYTDMGAGPVIGGPQIVVLCLVGVLLVVFVWRRVLRRRRGSAARQPPEQEPSEAAAER